MSEQSLTIKDGRTGKSYKLPHQEWNGARDRFAPDQNGRKRFWADDLRPCFDNPIHQERDHLH